MFVISIVVVTSTKSEFTEWTVLLWLQTDINESPSSILKDASSSFNSGVNMTSSSLLGNATTGYRNTMIDSWASNPPDIIRLSYRNKDGIPVYTADFNSTGLNSTEWFATTNAITGVPGSLHSVLHKNYTSYSVDFSISDNSWGIERYRATSLQLSNGSFLFIVGAGDSVSFLPATPVAGFSCYPSVAGTNQFFVNLTVTNLTHQYCSSICRERNYPYGAVHFTMCSCLEGLEGASVSGCTEQCEGDPSQPCGGSSPPAVLFNYVHTDIDTSTFDLLNSADMFSVSGTRQYSYFYRKHIYGYNIAVALANRPANMQMELVYTQEPCSETNATNTTLVKTFSVGLADTSYDLEFEPILAQCVTITLEDSGGLGLLSFPVTFTTKSLQSKSFVTADILAVEAAWLIEPFSDTSDTDDLCECECWVYNLLYGDSPYNNLTYEQIEAALRNVTLQLQKELSVNTSTLSSTIRKKTSADDKRPSAAAVGYTLGVALLVMSIGAILLADSPKMLRHMNILKNNILTSFCPKRGRFEPTHEQDMPKKKNLTHKQ